MNAILNTIISPFVLIMRRSGLLTEDLDYHLVRASMVIMFFFFGYQKWWPYEAERLVPFISNGPLIWWLYPVFGHQGASWFLGVSEWTFGTLLLAGFWDKRLGILGAAGFASKATGYLNTVLATPFYSRLAIFGSEAWAEVRDSSHPDEAGASTLTVQYRTGSPSVAKLSSRDSVRANLERFALSIEGKASYPFTEEQILDNIAVMSAVSRSIASGRSVSMAEVLSRPPI
jgi:Protein of unknown function, DUF417